MREFYGNDYLDFFYDADGKPFALNYNGTYYYYILNLQGDVIRLIDSNGITVAAYEYDPYGKIIYASGSMASINPLRYRGYYYDNETGLYYLQSRYYDPQTGRFISPDSYASTGQGILGHNMFAYCNNNPINYADHTGDSPWVVVGIIVACLLVIGLDHALAANQPDGGYALVNETNHKGATKRGLYAKGNGFEIDANGVTLVDTEIGLVSMYHETDYSRFDVLNCLTASATAELDWSGSPSIDLSAVASIYSPGAELTIPLGLFDVTITAVGHLGAVGAGIELDTKTGQVKLTPPFLGVGGSYGFDFDLNWGD